MNSPARISFLALLLCSGAIADERGTADVRSSRWGDAEDKVRGSEKAPKSELIRDVYAVLLGGERFLLSYEFSDVGLTGMSYTHTTLGGDARDVNYGVSTCDTVLESLSDKYGKPKGARRGNAGSSEFVDEREPAPASFLDWRVVQEFARFPRGPKAGPFGIRFAYGWETPRTAIEIVLSWNSGLLPDSPGFVACKVTYKPSTSAWAELVDKRRAATREAL